MDRQTDKQRQLDRRLRYKLWHQTFTKVLFKNNNSRSGTFFQPKSTDVFFFLFLHENILWVLIRRASLSSHNICFHGKIRKNIYWIPLSYLGLRLNFGNFLWLRRLTSIQPVLPYSHRLMSVTESTEVKPNLEEKNQAFIIGKASRENVKPHGKCTHPDQSPHSERFACKICELYRMWIQISQPWPFQDTRILQASFVPHKMYVLTSDFRGEVHIGFF